MQTKGEYKQAFYLHPTFLQSTQNCSPIYQKCKNTKIIKVVSMQGKAGCSVTLGRSIQVYLINTEQVAAYQQLLAPVLQATGQPHSKYLSTLSTYRIAFPQELSKIRFQQRKRVLLGEEGAIARNLEPISFLKLSMLRKKKRNRHPFLQSQ